MEFAVEWVQRFGADVSLAASNVPLVVVIPLLVSIVIWFSPRVVVFISGGKVERGVGAWFIPLARLIGRYPGDTGEWNALPSSSLEVLHPAAAWPPINDKPAVVVPNTVYAYGICDSIGHRPYMEDRNTVASSLRGDPEASFFAVFDGHAGPLAAEYCVHRMLPLLLSDPNYLAAPVAALTNAFQNTDTEFLAYARSCVPALNDGTTAVAALFRSGGRLYVANAGDSRAVMVRDDGSVEPLSEDHKPNRPDETLRIKRAGGTVFFHGVWRVSGVLAVSRAIGDRTLKPFVVSIPEVKRWTVTGRDRFLVLATDGVWDVLTNGDVAAIAMSLAAPSVGAAPLAGAALAQAIAAALVRYSLQRGSADNITALVVDLASRVAGRATAVAARSVVAASSSLTAPAVPESDSLLTVPLASIAAGSVNPVPISLSPLSDPAASASLGSGSMAEVDNVPNTPLSSLVSSTSDSSDESLVAQKVTSEAATVAGSFSPHPLRRTAMFGSESGAATSGVTSSAPTTGTSLRKRVTTGLAVVE